MSKSEKLLDLIKKNPMEAIDELLEISKSHPSIQDNSISIYRQAQELKIKEIRGELSSEQVLLKKSQITSAAIKIVREFEKIELNEEEENSNSLPDSINQIADLSPATQPANNWESAKEVSIKIGVTIAIVGGIGTGLYFLFDLFLIILLIILGGGIVYVSFFSEE